MKRLLSVLGTIGLFCGCSMLAWGQAGQSGGIIGQVTDQSGAAVAGASVTLTDDATGQSRTATSNDVGRYIFPNLSAGQFDVTVTKDGFQATKIPGQEVVLGNTTTVNVQIHVGSATQTVEVTSTAGAELQTTNSSMGTAIAGDELQNMPNVGAYRDVTGLVEYQANSTSGGQISGGVNDQNSFMLDGGNASDDTTGSPNYDTTFATGGSGVIPTPVESVEEMRVTTNNAGADFNGSSGGEVQLETRRGTAAWHGSAYDFFQSSVLNANTWANDRTGSAKQKTHQNRFGASIGGPIGPLGNFLGGKTFFFVNYEGRIFPQAATDDSSVPTSNLENGLLTFKDNAGNVDTWALNGFACAKTTVDPTGACDPRGFGLNPLIKGIWNTYMPTGNNLSGGDGLNSIGYLGQITDPTHDNFVVGRFDHDFGSNWHLSVSHRWYDLVSPDPGAQTDFGGVLPGDTKGVYTNAANRPQDPDYFVVGLSGTLSPTVTNQFHFNYVRNWWQWQSSPYAPEPVAGYNIAANIEQTLEPINVNSQSVRERFWYGHDWNYSDDLVWIHGNHLIGLGGTFSHKWMHFSRDDNGITIDTSLTYNIGDFLDTGLTFPSTGSAINYLPPICASGGANCLPSGSETAYENLYAEMIGAEDTSGLIFMRAGGNLALQPPGSNATDYDRVDSNYFYLTDTWKVTPSLTLSYGLNYGVQLPPYEESGLQTVAVDANGNPVFASQYLDQRQSAALAGNAYNPSIGWDQVRDIGAGMKYPFGVDFSNLAPRFAVAWSPNFKGGLLRSIFGANAGVLRGGYARVYDRENGVDLVFTPLLGDNFLQATTCSGLTTAGACLGIGNANVTPATVFRIGVDGNTVPLGNIAATEMEPVIPGLGSANGTPPGANAPPAGDLQSLDPGIKTPYADEFNVSFQRQLPGQMILEASYTFHRGERDLVRDNLDAVPYMMTLGGESFASAYAYLEQQYRAGAAPGNIQAQPFFEQALGGSSSAYCKAFASCTAAVYSNQATQLKNVAVTSLWDALGEPEAKTAAGQVPFVFGSDLASISQFTSFGTITSVGSLNYNSGAVSLNKRAAHGLTIDTNLTWAREFTNYGATAQLNVSVDPFNPYDLADDKSQVTSLPRFTYNLVANWQLPFGNGSKGLTRALLGGWSVAPILTWNSGATLPVTFGASSASAAGGGQPGDVDVSPTAIMTAPVSTILGGNAPNNYHGVLGSNGVGTNETSGSGTQVGYFTNPSAIVQTGGASGFTSADFRPYILGLDGNGYSAYLPGLHVWQVHFSALKDFRITEKFGATINAQAQNLFNHAQYPNPSLNLASLASFGDIGAATSGRVIEMGLRLHW